MAGIIRASTRGHTWARARPGNQWRGVPSYVLDVDYRHGWERRESSFSCTFPTLSCTLTKVPTTTSISQAWRSSCRGFIKANSPLVPRLLCSPSHNTAKAQDRPIRMWNHAAGHAVHAAMSWQTRSILCHG